MWKFVVIGLSLFVLYKLMTGDKSKKADQKTEQYEKMAQTGEMLKDPVCGSYVSKDSDIRVKNGDKVEVFCSYECRDKYIEELKKVQEDNE
jgi:YHS domain-containing protein